MNEFVIRRLALLAITSYYKMLGKYFESETMKISFRNLIPILIDSFSTVKKSKTPAQDRLEKTIISFKVPAKASAGKKTEYVSYNNNGGKEPWSRSNNSEQKRQKLVIPTKKKSAAVVSSIIEHIENKSESSADIPKIFHLKTPAQNRLTKLRKKLEANINSEMVNVEQVNDDSLHVIQNGFGIGNQLDVVDARNVSTSTVQNDDDMEMDWEPSFTEDAKQTEFSIEDIVFEDLSESAYIVPDTNVFLDSLVCIRSIMQKGVCGIHIAQCIRLTVHLNTLKLIFLLLLLHAKMKNIVFSCLLLFFKSWTD